MLPWQNTAIIGEELSLLSATSLVLVSGISSSAVFYSSASPLNPTSVCWARHLSVDDGLARYFLSPVTRSSCLLSGGYNSISLVGVWHVTVK